MKKKQPKGTAKGTEHHPGRPQEPQKEQKRNKRNSSATKTDKRNTGTGTGTEKKRRAGQPWIKHMLPLNHVWWAALTVPWFLTA